MRKIITVGLNDIIDIACDDFREIHEILGVIDSNSISVYANDEYIISFCNEPSESDTYNFLASNLAQTLIYGNAVFEKIV